VAEGAQAGTEARGGCRGTTENTEDTDWSPQLHALSQSFNDCHTGEDETDYAGATSAAAARRPTATASPASSWAALASLTQIDRDYWALPPGAPWVPLNFTLEAVKVR